MNIIQIILLVCCFLAAALLLGLLQHYLARNRSKSRIYWRNIYPLADLIFQLAHHRLTDNLINLVKIFFAEQLSPREILFLLYHLRCLHKLKKVFDKLDDTIDTAVVTDILSLGTVTLGPELSPFLLNLIDKEDLELLNQLVINNLISQKELYAFGNLMASNLYDQAILTLCYQNNNGSNAEKALIRQQIAQKNIEISGIYSTLVLHLIRKDKRIYALVSQDTNNELRSSDLKAIYSTTMKSGELMQIFHDTLEFRYDLRQEHIIGKITPNYFLAQLEIDRVLPESIEQINKLPDRCVSVYELPEAIRTTFLKVEHYLDTQSFAIGTITGLIHNLLRRYEVLTGFYAEKPNHRIIPVLRFTPKKGGSM